jgi:D-alanine-D-alanine ligase
VNCKLLNIAIVHNAVSEADGPDARDVLYQAETVRQALNKLGHRTASLSCTLDLAAIARQLKAGQFDLVINLVESLDGQGRLIHLFPYLLDALGLPYSGSPAEALLLTSDKAAAKKALARAELPTPDWLGPYPFRAKAPLTGPKNNSGTWIIKSVWEHASIGLDEASLLQTDSAETLIAAMRQRLPLLGGSCFAEQFIEGREFNLSILAGPHGPHILPPAEIIFQGFDEKTPRIVDYRAKWDENSFSYHNTPRTFSFAPEDEPLLADLRQMAERCWHLFGLGGYARVDFRVDEADRPWILEVNANPCLSPDAGFAAALEQAGVPFTEAMVRIVADAFIHTS